MDRDAALTALRNMVAATERPSLSTEDLDALLAQSAIPDPDGRLPQDTAWVSTWDLDRAAAEGWRWKAARVAGDFTFSADGGSFSKGEVMAKCLAMADQYASRGLSVLTVAEDRGTGPYTSPRLLVN